MRFCVNYRKLNQIIKKNKCSVLLIIETFAQLSTFAKFLQVKNEKTLKFLIPFITKFDVYK